MGAGLLKLGWEGGGEAFRGPERVHWVGSLSSIRGGVLFLKGGGEV